MNSAKFLRAPHKIIAPLLAVASFGIAGHAYAQSIADNQPTPQPEASATVVNPVSPVAVLSAEQQQTETARMSGEHQGWVVQSSTLSKVCNPNSAVHYVTAIQLTASRSGVSTLPEGVVYCELGEYDSSKVRADFHYDHNLSIYRIIDSYQGKEGDPMAEKEAIALAQQALQKEKTGGVIISDAGLPNAVGMVTLPPLDPEAVGKVQDVLAQVDGKLTLAEGDARDAAQLQLASNTQTAAPVDAGVQTTAADVLAQANGTAAGAQTATAPVEVLAQAGGTAAAQTATAAAQTTLAATATAAPAAAARPVVVADNNPTPPQAGAPIQALSRPAVNADVIATNTLATIAVKHVVHTHHPLTLVAANTTATPNVQVAQNKVLRAQTGFRETVADRINEAFAAGQNPYLRAQAEAAKLPKSHFNLGKALVALLGGLGFVTALMGGISALARRANRKASLRPHMTDLEAGMEAKGEMPMFRAITSAQAVEMHAEAIDAEFEPVALNAMHNQRVLRLPAPALSADNLTENVVILDLPRRSNDKRLEMLKTFRKAAAAAFRHRHEEGGYEAFRNALTSLNQGTRMVAASRPMNVDTAKEIVIAARYAVRKLKDKNIYSALEIEGLAQQRQRLCQTIYSTLRMHSELDVDGQLMRFVARNAAAGSELRQEAREEAAPPKRTSVRMAGPAPIRAAAINM